MIVSLKIIHRHILTFLIVLGLTSYASETRGQVTDNHTDHSQHIIEPVVEEIHAGHSETSEDVLSEKAQAENDHSGHQQVTDHKESDMQADTTATRSPHAYSGGYTRDQGLYVLPEDDQLALMDEQNFSRLIVNRLENLNQDGADGTRYDVQAWFGKTYSRFVLKAEGEYADGSLEDSRTELLWSQASSKFWDTQLGVRVDNGEGPVRSWLAAGVQGLAPYWFDVHATAFIGEGGRTAIGFEAEYEGRVTQRLTLKPRVDVNAYGKDDPARGIGSGLSDLTFGLRMQYQFTRQFVPYIGVERIRRFGKTADLLPIGFNEADTRWVAGLRFWF